MGGPPMGGGPGGMPPRGMEFDTIFVNEPLLHRLETFDWKKSGGDDGEDEEARDKRWGVAGLLYGLGIPHLSRHSVVLNATGKVLEEEQIKGVEFLSEIMPCGLEAYGVFVFTDKADKDGEVPECLESLVGVLPEQLLAVRDPLVFMRVKGKIKGHLMHEGKLVEYPILPISPVELEMRHITTIRIKGKITLESMLTGPDISNAFQHIIEKVASPYGTFQMEDTNLHFLHTLEAKSNASAGWVTSGTEDFKQEVSFVEDTVVTNIEDLGLAGLIPPEVDIVKAVPIDNLWKAQMEPEEEDDGYGVPEAEEKKPKRPKDMIVKRQSMNFRLRMKMSGDACTSKTLNCAPVIHYEKRDVKSVKIPLKIDALGYAPNSMKICDLMEILKGSVQRQIHEMARSVLSEFKMRGTVSVPQPFHLYPRPFGHFATIIYTKTGTCAAFAHFRKHLHQSFLLPADRPYFRRQNKFVFAEDKKTVGTGPLMNVHVGLEPPKIEGEVAMVQGAYTYYHYMQDKFNDDGWGCAYRSLQTLISWFRIQGYTETKNPSHAQIQKCLVKLGDKPKDFIDSKQWIGSTEVGYVLEESCQIQSMFLSVSSGEELASKGRELSNHFKKHGTPVMIGGGVLAHTIIGVAWNEETGDIQWLILDPHFTGSDWENGRPNIKTMHSKGWIGWKGPDFWDKTAFYNMCMPQRPDAW